MEIKKIKKYLIIGLIGAIITVIGEMSQGLAETIKSTDMIAEMFSSYASLPGWRLGFGSTVGTIGILFQYFGLYAIYLSFKNKEDKSAKNYKLGIYNFIFVGAIVHVLLSIAMYVYKIDSTLLMEYMIWFVVPILVIFLIGYIWFSIIMFNKFLKSETLFPKWCCILNPIIGKVVFNIIALLTPISSLSNGINNSNMGITSIVMFIILLNVKSIKSE